MSLADEAETYHTLNDEQNKEIITALAAKSQSTEVQRIILAYDIGMSGAHIRKQIQKHKMPQLKEAAELLKLNIDRVKKNQLVSNIIHQIESLLREKCDMSLFLSFFCKTA